LWRQHTKPESETFDLGGQSTSTIINTIKAAFSEPLPLDGTMIRLTFITGAGKLGRQKYDPDAAKAVTTTLRDLGYDEDRGASCVVECAGSFKLQHDTGKNLKTVVVFPKILVPGTQASLSPNQALATLLPEGSPEHMIATSSMNTFQRMITSKCPSWSQKKGCAAALEELRQRVQQLDAKLVTGTPLDAAEQDFYDTVSYLEDKEEYVRTEMHNQVERGDVTVGEKEMLLAQNAERIAVLQKDTTKKAQLEKARQRKKLLSDIVPHEPNNLRHEVAIRKLRKELLPYLQMEEEQKGRLRSVKETQVMARKDEIEQEIAILEEESRGWFEDEGAFQARVAASRATFAATHKPKTKKVTPSSNFTYSQAAKTAVTANSKWVLPGDAKNKGAGATSTNTSNKKKGKSKGGAVFSAMMIDDDDEDDDEDAPIPRVSHQQTSSKSKPVTTKTNETSAETTKSSSTGTKKNKKSKKKTNHQSEDDALDQAFSQQQAAKAKKDEDEAKAKQVSHPAISFVRDYVVPVLAAILTWLVTLVLGKPKKRKEKER
jgi:hypothetical protein